MSANQRVDKASSWFKWAPNNHEKMSNNITTRLIGSGDAQTGMSGTEQTSLSDSTLRSAERGSWFLRLKRASKRLKAQLGFSTGDYNAEEEVTLPRGWSSRPDPRDLAATFLKINLNLNQEIVGVVDGDYVDARPAWLVRSSEGLASLTGLAVDYTVRSGAFNASVTVGGAVGTLGVMSGVGGLAYIPLAVGVASTWVVKAIKDRSEKPQGVDVALSILNGDLVLSDTVEETVIRGDLVLDDPSVTAPDPVGIGGASTVQASVGSSVSGGTTQSIPGCQVVPVAREKRFFQRKPKHRGRIPVAAGELACILKVRHTGLRDTPANRLLVRADAGRRAEGLRREEHPHFENMRNRDLLNVVMHASEMYWLLSSDEEYVEELYSNRWLRNLRRRMDRFNATFSPG